MKDSSSSFPKKLERGLLLLYEDPEIIIVDKPAGLLSIAREGGREKTVYWILAEYLKRRGGGRSAPAVVHRLDRDTSGVMIFAKSGKTKKTLMENWDTLLLKRRYIAVAEGEMGADGETEGRINAPLGEDRSGRVIVKENGKPSVTRWTLLEKGGFYSLLALELETGRRNQIRAHLSWKGHPVAGDKKYNAASDPIKRLCLHAETISFHHPRDGKIMEFCSPVPEGFTRIFSKKFSKKAAL